MQVLFSSLSIFVSTDKVQDKIAKLFFSLILNKVIFGWKNHFLDFNILLYAEVRPVCKATTVKDRNRIGSKGIMKY